MISCRDGPCRQRTSLSGHVASARLEKNALTREEWLHGYTVEMNYFPNSKLAAVPETLVTLFLRHVHIHGGGSIRAALNKLHPDEGNENQCIRGSARIWLCHLRATTHKTAPASCRGHKRDDSSKSGSSLGTVASAFRRKARSRRPTNFTYTSPSVAYPALVGFPCTCLCESEREDTVICACFFAFLNLLHFHTLLRYTRSLRH